MCIKIEQMREEIEKALTKNNKLRDKNLENKLSETRKKIYEHMEELINPLKSDCIFRKNEQETLKNYLNEHTEQNRQDFDKIMQAVKEVNETVSKKLIPAYEEAQRKEITIGYIKDVARSWQFWLKAVLAVIGSVALIRWLLTTPAPPVDKLKF